MTDAKRDHFGTAAVEIETTKLAVVFVVQDVVARLPDLDVQLIVRADG